MEKQKVIMAIGGHVGDAELTSGGVLATLSLSGWKVVTVALTGGERGNPPHLSVAEYRIQKEKEAHDFAQMLRGEAIVLPYIDGELPDNEKVRLEVCDIIRKYKPDVITTHWKYSMHKDHIATSNIVRDAHFLAALPGVTRENPHHFARGPYYAENWEDAEKFTPYLYINVSSEGFKLWEEAISTHWFTTNSKSFKYKEYYASLMKCRGCIARSEYAVAFDIDEHSKKVVMNSL